ncbi:hypothetical protein D3C72_1088600 [compost metagenome]
MAVAGAHAVRTRIAAADHDHVLALGQRLVRQAVTRHGLVLLAQEVHGEIHARQFTARNRQVARRFRTARHDDRVEFRLQRIRRAHRQAVGHGVFRIADVGGRRELHAFRFHLRDAAVDLVLFQLEVGDAVAQQAADAVALFEQRHRVAGARQLLRARHAGGAGAHHRDLLARLAGRHLRRHPAFFPALVDDRVFDGLDAHGVAVDVQGTGGFTRRRADAARELREVVGGVQHVQRAAPVLLVHQVIPVGDDVVDRAAVVAERDAAVHAARGLLLGLVVGQVQHEFAPVLQPLLRGLGGLLQTLKFHKAGNLSHGIPHAASCCGLAARHISPNARR